MSAEDEAVLSRKTIQGYQNFAPKTPEDLAVATSKAKSDVVQALGGGNPTIAREIRADLRGTTSPNDVSVRARTFNLPE